MKMSYINKRLILVIIIFLIGASVNANECNCDKIIKNREGKEWTNNFNENLALKYSIDQLCGLVEPDDWYVNAYLRFYHPEYL